MTLTKDWWKEKAPGVLAPLGLAGLTAAFYWKVLWGGAIFALVDASRFFYPFWKWGSVLWREGRLPLWNPDAQFGTPYFADPQMAAAYPPVGILYSLLPPTDAFAALVVLHHFWALLGFWVLARHEGFKVPAALLGALAFGFSLHVVCSSWTPVALLTISWIPWIFWAAQRLWERWAGAWLWLSVFWALQTAAGYPVLSYLTGLALSAHLAWKSMGTRPWRLRAEAWHWVFPFGAAVGLALLYNLAWGLPFWELKRLSDYAPGAALAHPLGFKDFATWLAPFFQGHPASADYHGASWVGFYYMGLPAAALLVWGFWKAVFLRTSPWLFGLLVVLSLGETLYLASGLKAFLPGYSLVIRSGFWMALVVLFAARLIMEASENFFRKEFRKGPFLFSWAAAWLLVYALGLGLGGWQVTWAWALSLLLGLLAAAPGWFTLAWRWFFLLLSLMVSLGPAASSVNLLMDRSYYDQAPLSGADLDRPGRLFLSPLLWQKAQRLQGADWKQAYQGAKEAWVPDWPLAFGHEEAEVYNSLYLSGPDNWIWASLSFSPQKSRAALDYLNVRYLVGPNHFRGLQPVGPGIFENPSAFPKWFSVRRAFAASGLAADFEKAAKPSWNYGTDCFVENPAWAGDYEPRKVVEIRRSPQELELGAEGKGKALLVSSETAYPGWKARIEGKSGQLQVVNHVFRGIVLQPGEDRVTLSYEPASFRLGLFGALTALFIWTLGFFRRRFT